MGPKKGRRKHDDDDWENEVLGELEKLKVGGDGNDEPEEELAVKPKGKKKTRPPKAAQVNEEIPREEWNANEVEVNEPEERENWEEREDKEEREEKKGKKEKKERDDVEGVTAKEEPPQVGTVKTAAQKRAEKKQREKEKKQKDARTKKAVQEEEDLDDLLAELGATPQGQPAAAKAAADEPPTEPQFVAAEPKADGDSGGDGEGTAEGEGQKGKKKKKKAAKKEAKEEEVPKATKTNARVRAMQEAIQRQRELEERLRREEEEAQRAAEERLRKEEEEARLEQERRKERKRREAERKARLKAEGKLLTRSQKEAQAKREAFLASLMAQGMDLPKAPESGKKKRVVYDNRKKKQMQTFPQDQSTDEAAKGHEEMDSGADSEGHTEEDHRPPRADGGAAMADAADDKETEDAPDNWDDEVADDWEEADVDVDEEKAAEAEAPAAPEPAKGTVKHLAAEVANKKAQAHDQSESESNSDIETEAEGKHAELEKVRGRIEQKNREAETAKSHDNLRSPVCCVLGHVDTGKTKILDHIRHTNVQTGEAGGITQQIGATYVPTEVLKDRTMGVNPGGKLQIRVPGLLIIDTPGHESFSNLRMRGSSLCDISVLVVDIMHGLEQQTIESINLLRSGKTPFVVALNKVDRLYEWKPVPNSPFRQSLKKQMEYVQKEFKERTQQVLVQLAEQGLNAQLYYENTDMRKYVSLVPTSAHTGEGIPDLLMLLVQLTQKLMADRIAFVNKVECSVLEVKMVQGLGTTIDVILSQGVLRTGDTIVVSGLEGPIITTVRALLMPQPLKELRVKNAYQNHDEVYAAQGVKISAKGLEDAVAGTQLYVAHGADEVEYYRSLVKRDLEQALAALRTDDRGVSTQASTLGALEALLVFLRENKVPVSNVNIGPVNRRDVVKCATMMTHNEEYGMILAFDVKVAKDAAELAKEMGVIIFTADIIYHLFDRFMEHMARYREKKKAEVRHMAWFPCQLAIKPEFVFNTRDPIVLGVDVVEGRLVPGVPIVVPCKGFVEIGVVESIEVNNKNVSEAKVGQAVCVKIRNTQEAPRMFGRHFEETDPLYTNLKRETIDILKEYFRDDMTKEDWRLILKMKKIFSII